jgi:hypothetical protein
LLGEVVHTLPLVGAFSGKWNTIAPRKMLASTITRRWPLAAGTARRVI